MTTGCVQAVNRDSLMESTTFGSFDYITNLGGGGGVTQSFDIPWEGPSKT